MKDWHTYLKAKHTRLYKKKKETPCYLLAVVVLLRQPAWRTRPFLLHECMLVFMCAYSLPIYSASACVLSVYRRGVFRSRPPPPRSSCSHSSTLFLLITTHLFVFTQLSSLSCPLPIIHCGFLCGGGGSLDFTLLCVLHGNSLNWHWRQRAIVTDAQLWVAPTLRWADRPRLCQNITSASCLHSDFRSRIQMLNITVYCFSEAVHTWSDSLTN